MLTTGPINFNPDAFLDRSRRFLSGREIPIDTLNRGLKDPHVAHVMARMEGEREGRPTLTGIEQLQGKIRFKVCELSVESPIGGFKHPGHFGQQDHLANRMQGRGAPLSETIALTEVGAYKVLSCLTGSQVWVWQPRPMTLVEYHEVGQLGVQMDLNTTSYLLPPWDESFRNGVPWFRDGVYLGERGQVVRISTTGSRGIWKPEDEQFRDPDPDFDPNADSEVLKPWVKGSPNRGVRYAFEFML